uniref:PBPe domain-containing protein n=2 Tax=Macrostomum lignano TaxID=282301 RepID=A0A1I8IN61_9PLAT
NAHLSMPYAITTLRSQVVDFSFPLASSGNTILVRRPPPSTRMWNIFAPLSYDVWLLLLGVLCTAAFFTYLLAYFSPFTAWNLGVNYSFADEVWLQEYIWSFLGSLLQQGQDFYPFAMSPRSILAFWWFLTVILLAAYTGNLTAYLTVSVTQLPIRTLEDVLANQHYKVLVSKGTNIYAQILLDTSGPYYELRKQMKVVDSMPICSQTVAVDSNPYQVCIVDQNINIHFYNAYCNKVYIADQTFNAYSLGVAFPKGAFYLPAFSFLLEKSQDSGLSQWLEYKYFPRSNAECVVSAVTAEADPITIEGVAGAFIVTGGLYVCGILLLLLELLFELIPELRRQAPTAESMNNFLPPLLLLLLLLAQPSPLRCSTFKVAIVIEDTTISAETVNLAVTRAVNNNYRIFPSGSGRRVDFRLVNASRCQSVEAVRKGGCALMESLQKLGKTLTLPTIVIPNDFCSLASESVFEFIGAGDPSQLLRAAVEALRFHLAPTVAIFYDRFQSLPLLEAFQNDLSASGISVMAFQLDEGKNLSEILTVLIKGQVRFNVIFATAANVIQTLETARNATLLQQNYHWLLLSFGLSLSSLKPIAPAGASSNLLVVRDPTYGLLGMTDRCISAVQDIFPECDKSHVTSLEYRFTDALTALGKAFNDFANSTGDSHPASNATCLPLQPWIGGNSVSGFISSLRGLDTFRSVISYNASSNRLEAPYVEFAATFNELADQPVDFVESARFYPANASLRVLRTVSGRSLVFSNAFVDFKNRTLTVCAPS